MPVYSRHYSHLSVPTAIPYLRRTVVSELDMYTPSTLVTLLALFAYATMLEAAPLSRRSHASLALRLRQSSSANNTQYGCGSNPSWDFDSTGHSNQTLGDRSFLVHIPADYKSTTKHAMVLSFHGFKGDDLQQEKISQFSEPGLTVNGAVRTLCGRSECWG